MPDSEKPLSLAESIRRKIMGEDTKQSNFPVEATDSSAPAPPSDIVAERYKLLHKLEEDAKTETFAAKHAFMDRDVAIEIMKPEFANDAETQEAMLIRARELSRMATESKYGSVCDFGQMDDGRSYLIFAKASSDQHEANQLGGTLADSIRRKLAE